MALASMPGSEPANALDGTGAKRWRAPADVKSAWLEVDLGKAEAIGAFGLDEPDVWPRLNQKFTLEAFGGGAWKKVADGKTNGHGGGQNITPVTAQRFRVTMECEKGSPGVAELQLYRAEQPSWALVSSVRNRGRNVNQYWRNWLSRRAREDWRLAFTRPARRWG